MNSVDGWPHAILQEAGDSAISGRCEESLAENYNDGKCFYPSFPRVEGKIGCMLLSGKGHGRQGNHAVGGVCLSITSCVLK